MKYEFNNNLKIANKAQLMRELNSGDIRIEVKADDIHLLIADGIIRKVEEPKWTDSDMIEFVRFFIRYDHQGVEANFKNWVSKKEGK